MEAVVRRLIQVLMLVLVTGSVNAGVDVTIIESGGNVIVSSSGTLPSALCSSLTSSITISPVIRPSNPWLQFGGNTEQCNGVTITGPSNFGTGSTTPVLGGSAILST